MDVFFVAQANITALEMDRALLSAEGEKHVSRISFSGN